MDPAVSARYTSETRAAVAAAVGVPPERMRDLGGFESFVHEVEIDGRARIVKATWGGRRTAEEMGAELHFTTWLADRGASVARPLPLARGELQEAVPASDGVFHVTAWAKAEGRSLRRDELAPDVFVPWGALLGRLHRLSSEYPGPPPPLARPSWQAELRSYADLVAADADVHEAFLALLARLEGLPRTRATFGAMHTDPHHYNIFWHDGRPTIFDFEDMLDFWFVSDLAIVLFYAVMSPPPGVRCQALYDAFVGPLLAGYETEYALPEGELDTLPLFLALREQELRAVAIRSLAPEERTPGMVLFLEESTQRIRAGRPALDLRVDGEQP